MDIVPVDLLQAMHQADHAYISNQLHEYRLRGRRGLSRHAVNEALVVAAHEYDSDDPLALARSYF